MKSNTLPILLAFYYLTSISGGRAENPTVPEGDAEPAQTEIQKWIATTDAQWQAAYKRDVSDVHDAEINKIKSQYQASLDAEISKVISAGDLDKLLALREEKERTREANVFPLPEAATDAPVVKQNKTAVRGQVARVDRETAVRAKALQSRYDQVLAQAEKQLTQRGRLEDAVLIKAKRDQIVAAWLGQIGASEVAATPVLQAPRAPLTSLAGAAAMGNAEAGQALLSKENAPKWKPQSGKWTNAGGVLTGQGDSMTWYEETLHPPFTLRFKIKILDGMRPRVRVGGIGCNNEGYETTLALYPPGPGAGVFNYERHKAYRVALAFTRQETKFSVDDKLISTGPGIDETIKSIGFSAGDGWSAGKVQYSDIALVK